MAFTINDEEVYPIGYYTSTGERKQPTVSDGNTVDLTIDLSGIVNPVVTYYRDTDKTNIENVINRPVGYRSAYHSEDVIPFLNTMTLGGLNNLSPTLWLRRGYDTGKLLNGNMNWTDYSNSWIYGNNGIFTDLQAAAHPIWAAVGNGAADILTLGGAGLLKSTVGQYRAGQAATQAFNNGTWNYIVGATSPNTGLRTALAESPWVPRTAFWNTPAGANISLAERLGIPKGDRGNLSLFQSDALEDLNLYINSGLYRQLPTINMETAEPSWVSPNGNVSALKLLIDDGVPSSGRLSWAWNRPNGGTYELVTDGKGNFGIGYNSYRLFDISPEFNSRVGEASAGSARHGYSKIFLTAPRNDARHFIVETPELELAKKTLIETQSPRISKDIMRDFWSGVQLSLRPGAYLSGDEGMLPKGSTLIRQFKELPKKGYRRDNNGNIIGSGRTNWEDIRNSLMRNEKWKRREDGLSTDSYLALLKQANRENSPYYLRYSPDGFTTFNNQSIDNKFISDLLEKTKTGEVTLLEFLDAFHNWVSPYGGMDAKIVNGEIVIPHPFLYKKKLGGVLTKNN